MDEASLLGSGPAQVLSAMARTLRLPFDPDDVADRVEAHAEPRSLLALVEVATAVGLRAQAFQAEWADLDEVKGPAVVHLEGESDRGFALLLEHDAGEVLLEAPTTRRRVRLDRAAFEALWSGVVVLLERDPTATPALDPGPRGLRTGAPLARPRVLALGGLVGLSLLGCVRYGLDAGLLVGVGALAVTAATLIAATVSAVLVLASRRSRVGSATPALVSRMCARGSLFDCEGVLGSKFAHLGGIELSVLGLAFLGGAAVLEALGAVLTGSARAGLAAWVGAAFVLAAPGALALIAVQIWPLKRFCPLCMTVHACVLAAAGLSLPLLAGSFEAGILPWARTVAPWAVLHLVGSLATAGLVVPFLEGAIESRTYRSRLAWIGSTPLGALAELAGRPPVPDWGLAAGARLGEAGARFRADALVHPTCGGCPPLLDSLERLVKRRPRDVQVVLQFPPRDPGRAEDRELCVALAVIGLREGGPAALAAFLAAKSAAWKLLETARAGGALAVLAALAPDLAPDDAALAAGRDAVARADRVLADLRRGTPTLLLGGRPWDAPLEDLEALLAAEAERLASVLGLPAPVERA